MNISFAWTTPAFRARRKTCTRRDWDDRYAGRFSAGQVLQAYDRQARFGGHKIGTIRLTARPYKENTMVIPSSDWEAEGFDYLTEIGARVHNLSPIKLWDQWRNEPVYMWVVRFEILEVLNG